MDSLEVEELAIAVLGLNEEDDPDEEAIFDALYEKLGVTTDQFQSVAEALMPFTIPGKAEISGEVFNGFIKDGAFIVKQLVKP